MKTIPLSNRDDCALVDDEDYDMLLSHNTVWYCGTQCGMIRCWSKKLKKNVIMARLLVSCSGSETVDHRDGNKKNNQKHNLRPASKTLQSFNRVRKNKTGYRGVNINPYGGFRAYAKLNGLLTYLGKFETKEEAALAYNNAVAKQYPEDIHLLNVIK